MWNNKFSKPDESIASLLHPVGKCMLTVKLCKCELCDFTALVVGLVNNRYQMRKAAGECGVSSGC